MEYYLKITDFEGIESQIIEKGKFYTCFTDVFLLEFKIVASKDIEKNGNIYHANCRVFTDRKLKKTLKKKGFNQKEINLILDEFNLEENVYSSHISYETKALIVIDILFKNSDLILFNTIGMSYDGAAELYRRIDKNLKKHPQKTAIVFELITFYHKTEFKIVYDWNIQNYREWIISHKIESPFYMEIRNLKDISSFDVKKGTIYTCFTEIPNLAKKLLSTTYPNVDRTASVSYNKPNIFKRFIKRFFLKMHFKTRDIDKLDTLKNVSQLFDLSNLHMSDIIFFETKYWPVEIIPDTMIYIYNKHLEFPHKTIIIFEEIKGYGKTSIEIIDKPIIDNYMNWRLKHLKAVRNANAVR